MSFLLPAVLGAAVAAGLPVLIHLLNKTQVREVAWAAMRFLENAVKKNERRMRIQDLLLLVLRMLLILLAVLAFARPVLLGPPAPGAGSVRAVMLVMDHSLSMDYTDGRETRLDKARREAVQLLDNLPEGSAAGLLLATDRAEPVVGVPSENLALVKRRLAMMEQSARGAELLPALQAAVNALRNETGRPREIHIFTDDQQAAWSKLGEIRELAAQHPNISWIHHPVGNRETENLAITGIQTDPAFPVPGQPLQVRIQVQNQGIQAASGLRAVVAAGSRVENEAFVDSLGPGETRTLTMDIRAPPSGDLALTASLPQDNLPLDNQCSLVVPLPKPAQVWIVAGTEDEAGTAFFLRNALLPIPADKKSAHPIQIRQIRPAQAATMDLENSPLVIVCNPTQMDQGAVDLLREYVRAGGTVWVFPSKVKGPSSATWPNVYEPLTQGAAHGIRLQASNYYHPVTEPWNDPASGSLRSVRFRQRAPLKIPDSDGAEPNNARIVLAFEDGSPAIIEWGEGKGRMVASAFGLDSAWGNFQLHPGFVPLIQRLLGHTSPMTSRAQTLEPGELFVGKVDPRHAGKPFTVQIPGEAKPVGAGVVEERDGDALVTFRRTMKPGIYQIYLAEEKNPVLAFAVQPPLQAGLPKYASGAEIDQVFKPQAAGNQGEAIVLEPTVRAEFWLMLIVCVVALSAAELALAHRFSQSL